MNILIYLIHFKRVCAALDTASVNLDPEHPQDLLIPLNSLRAGLRMPPGSDIAMETLIEIECELAIREYQAKELRDNPCVPYHVGKEPPK